MNWFTISLIGAISIAVHQFSITKLTKLGLSIGFINAVIYSIAAIILIIIYQVTDSEPLAITRMHVFWIVIGVFSIIGVIVATLEALDRSVNPGYVGAILSTSAILLTLLSLIFFKSPITLTKTIGIGLALIGAILLGI